MKEQLISIKDYHYDLPIERIAKYPLEKRDESKLLVYKNGNYEESTYSNLDTFLPKDTILFFNNTKVIPARLIFKTSTDKTIELFCLEPATNTDGIYHAMMQTKKVLWKCIVGGASKWKEPTIYLTSEHIQIQAQIIERLSDSFLIEFNWEPSDKNFSEVLQIAGAIPIPPYLKRSSETIDSFRYQTLYAKHEGSVAATTAGLHFTDSLLKKLKDKNIIPHYITLHVGAGTFKPVKTETMMEHEMHREFIDVPLSAIETILLNPHKPIGAVGTTSLRTIESLYWLGVKAHLNPDITQQNLIVNQWDPYQLNQHSISTKEAIQSLYNYMVKHQLNQLYTQTSLLIVPGYDFKIINLLITNFHQPESTLILLVAAFIGEDWRKVYQYALDHNFGFLSYGDGCLLHKRQDL